eukprot:893550-Alexandrium_andersonii.AAC.1
MQWQVMRLLGITELYDWRRVRRVELTARPVTTWGWILTSSCRDIESSRRGGVGQCSISASTCELRARENEGHSWSGQGGAPRWVGRGAGVEGRRGCCSRRSCLSCSRTRAASRQLFWCWQLVWGIPWRQGVGLGV